jgi:hypothetical protein
MIQSYKNSYSKWLYSSNTKSYGQGYLEVQLHRYPFHSGIRLLVTDGYTYVTDIHCKDIFEAKREFRKQQSNMRGDK